MKKRAFFAVLFASHMYAQQIAGITNTIHSPLVSEQLANQITNHLNSELSGSFVGTEGQSVSLTNSPLFVLPSTNQDGAQILTITNLVVSTDGVQVFPSFVDRNSGQEFLPSFVTYDVRTNANDLELSNEGVCSTFLHFGEMTVGGTLVHIVIVYQDTLDNPYVLLTWGEGSDYAAVGKEIDTFVVPQVFEANVETELALGTLGPGTLPGTSELGDVPPGLYLVIKSANNFGIQSSKDFVNWQDVSLFPMFNIGYLWVYRLTEPGETFLFYRAKQ